MKYVYVSGTPNIQNGVARSGTPARLLGVASGLSRAGADVAFVLEDRGQFAPSSDRPFDVHLVHSSNYHHQEWMHEYVQALAPDAFVCAYPDVIASMGPALSAAGIIVVYDIHDDDAKVAETLGESPERVAHYRETQMKAIRQADVMWVSTRHERDLATSTASKSQTVLFVPNGSPDELIEADCFAADGDVVFVGNGLYPPNARAVARLQELMQLASSEQEMAPRVRVVGQGYEAFEASPHLDIRGFVPSLQEGIRGAALGLAPLLTGAGAKMKVRDYCAAGLPVLSTTEGALGLPACLGVVIEDNLERWPSLIADLRRSPDRLQEMSAANQTMIKTALSWRCIGADTDRRMQRIDKTPLAAAVVSTGPLMPPRWAQDNAVLLVSGAGTAEPGGPVVLPRNAS